MHSVVIQHMHIVHIDNWLKVTYPSLLLLLLCQHYFSNCNPYILTQFTKHNNQHAVKDTAKHWGTTSHFSIIRVHFVLWFLDRTAIILHQNTRATVYCTEEVKELDKKKRHSVNEA